MKNSNYINRVLSHIKDGESQREVGNELFDHIDENRLFYKNKENDDETAFENAEKAMGDPDMVGEQLDAIKGKFFNAKRLNLIYSILCILLLIAIHFASTQLSKINFAQEEQSISISPFILFCALSILFIMSLLNMRMGIKKRNIISITSGFMVSEIIVIGGPFYYCDLISNLLHKESAIIDFFIFYNPYETTMDTADSLELCVISCISISILLLYIAGLTVIIKTKMLKNTLKDMKRKNLLIAITGLVAIFCFLATCAVTGLVISQRNIIYHNIFSKYQKSEQEFINSIDSFMTLDYYEINRCLDEITKGTDIKKDYNLTHRGIEESTDGFTYISEEFDYDDSGTITAYYLTFNCEASDPLSLRNTVVNAYDKNNIINDINNIYDIPLPAEIEFSYSKRECQIKFSYGSEGKNKEKYVIFAYNNETKKFELIKTIPPQNSARKPN